MLGFPVASLTPFSAVGGNLARNTLNGGDRITHLAFSWCIVSKVRFDQGASARKFAVVILVWFACSRAPPGCHCLLQRTGQGRLLLSGRWGRSAQPSLVKTAQTVEQSGHLTLVSGLLSCGRRRRWCRGNGNKDSCATTTTRSHCR